MRIGIVTDSACDLPRAYRDQHNIRILPITLRFGDDYYRDVRDPDETKAFYQRFSDQRDVDAETQPLSVDEVADIFLDELVLDFERVIVITVSASRSPIFNNTTEASFKILKEYRARRAKAGLEGQFSLRVMDSQTLFTGQAVLVQEAVRLLEEEQTPFDQLRPTIEKLTRHVYAYLVPRSLYHVYHNGRKKGDKSISWLRFKLGSMLDVKPVIQMHRGDTGPVATEKGFDAALGNLFDRASKEIDTGLRTRTVAMSYAGDPGEMRSRDDFKAFEAHAAKAGVQTTLSVMSTTAGINVGPGAFSLAYISGEKD
jgi:DegV family protein with EDD domain